jgi:hypothetical protein
MCTAATHIMAPLGFKIFTSNTPWYSIGKDPERNFPNATLLCHVNDTGYNTSIGYVLNVFF